MNICFYTLSLPNPLIGGIERVTYNLTSSFEKNGFKVFNLTSIGQNHPGKIKGINLDEKVNFINKFLKDNDIEILIDQYGSLPVLNHEFISKNVKIIYCHHQNHLSRSLIETFSFSNFKYSLINLAFILNTPRRNLKLKRKFLTMFKDSEKGIDLVVFLSDMFLPIVKKRYAKIVDIEKKITAIQNAAEPKLSEIIPVSKEKSLVWCGRIAHNPKNVIFLVKLWRKLYKHNKDWNFILVGDGIDRKLLEKYIRKHKLERIIITGFQDPYPYFSKSSFFIFPSFSEGFSMALIESMAHGCLPIVFDTCAAFQEIIDNNKTGFIIDDYKPKEFIKLVDMLMKEGESERIKRMRKEAVKSIENFSINKITEKWLALFNEIKK